MATMFAYIPLEKRIAHKKGVASQRRSWLERAHARNPRCFYCKNVTVLKPAEYSQLSGVCGRELYATLDHVVPLAKGGWDKPNNYRLACSVCNMLKADRDERDFIEELRAA